MLLIKCFLFWGSVITRARHRGRSAIEWAIRMYDAITGGTIFWLNSGIDRGDIAHQDWCFIPPEYVLNPKERAKNF